MEGFYDGSDSLFTRAYDSIHGEAAPIAGDVAFYRDLAHATGGPVLEIACGSGRVALPLAEHGLDITGVDSSEGMLAIARRRRDALPGTAQQRVTLVAQEMTRLDLGRRFGCIFVAFRSFQHLLTVDLQRKALTAMRQHLAPDGRLALHLFDPRLDLLIDDSVRQPPLSGFDPVTRRRYVGEVIRVSLDHVGQVRRDLWRYREFDANGVQLEEGTRELTLRWTHRQELHHLLELCGLSVEAEYSDFARSPPAYGKELIVVAKP